MTCPLEANLNAVRKRLERAALAAGREPHGISLLPVTKSVGVQLTDRLRALGWGELAENRAEPFTNKAGQLTHLNIRWHFIGHLQRNKARRVLQHASVLHSVDSLRLLETLDRITRELDKPLDIYLQVKLSPEEEKHGLRPEELETALQRAAQAPLLNPLGLMVMGPKEDHPLRPQTQGVFAAAAALRDTLQVQQPRAFVDQTCRLSMGMSADLELAVQAGSQVVRVGTDLFRGVPDPEDPLSEGTAREGRSA